jgi:hypothetical protein
MPTLIHNQVTVSVGPLEIACHELTALTLEDAPEIFRAVVHFFPNPDPVETAHEICDILRDGCNLERSHEHLFVLLYFNRVIEKLKLGSSLHSCLLPLPKARFSLAGCHSSVTVDFAFWTGKRFVVVFIHESPFDRHGREEGGLLKAWGFEVFGLMADEFETRGLMGETGLNILGALRLR